MWLVRLWRCNAGRASSRSLGLSSTSRISTRLCIVPVSQCKTERGATIRFGLSPDVAAVAVHDALHDRQAYARTLVVLGPVQPLKDSEELARVPHIEADAVVANEVDRLAVPR